MVILMDMSNLFLKVDTDTSENNLVLDVYYSTSTSLSTYSFDVTSFSSQITNISFLPSETVTQYDNSFNTPVISLKDETGAVVDNGTLKI